MLNTSMLSFSGCKRKTPIFGSTEQAIINICGGAEGLRKLIDAVQRGQSEAVINLLSQVSDDKKQVSLNQLALQCAAMSGRADLVRLLLDRGALPNRKDGHGYTALMNAAMTGHAATGRVLLAGGADPNTGTGTGVTALMLACGNNRPEVVRVLLEHGADPRLKSKTSKETALMMAARSGCLDAIMLFVDQGVPVEDKTIGGPASGYVGGLTPLMFAAGNGQSAVVQYLMSHGADPDTFDEDGHNASWYATRVGRSDICAMLERK